MRPGHLAVIGEIARIGLDLARGLARVADLEGNPVALGVGDRFFLGVEGELGLVIGPANDWLGGEMKDDFRFEVIEYPRQEVGLADICLNMGDPRLQVQGGEINFDVVIASPDAMRVVGKLGTILGPRGLMPNPKVGTVTPDVAQAVKNAKGGQVRYRTDKGGIVHCTVGQVGFDANAIKENVESLLADLKKAKPSSAKGTYFKKVTLSTTMGPGLNIDPASLAM